MPDHVVYCQINKDHAYWPEKRRVGQTVGGHTAGLLTHFRDGSAIHSILFDAGLGTIQGLTERGDFSWECPLDIFVTHGHPDHHLELMILSEIWCLRATPNRRDPLKVYCTGSDTSQGTYRFLFPAHSFRFATGGDQTLQQVPVSSTTTIPTGIFTVHAIDVDHFPGAVIYVVEFGTTPRHKIIIGWDLKTLPSPLQHSILQRPSLALLEANSWDPLSAKTGHTSVTELVETGFIANLQTSLAQDQYGIFLVHYGGAEDQGGTIPDAALEVKFRATWPDLAGIVGVARRGQSWQFGLS